MNTDKRLMKQAKQLARKECCNYFDGDCIYTDNLCHVINPMYPSIHSGAIGWRTSYALVRNGKNVLSAKSCFFRAVIVRSIAPIAVRLHRKSACEKNSGGIITARRKKRLDCYRLGKKEFLPVQI